MCSSSPDRTGAASPEDARWSTPIGDLLADRARRTPQLTAVLDERGRELTFGELGAHSARVAAELAERGVTAATRVAWQLPTWIETLVLSCALSRLGAVQIPLPHAYRAHEIRAALLQTDADLVVAPEVWRGHDYAGMLAATLAEHPDLAGATLQPDHLSLTDWFPSLRLPERPHRTVVAADVRWVFFTSGTSGAPKAVLHTDRGVSIPATTMADAFELGPDDRSAVAFPLGHIGGVNWLIASLQTGCALLVAERLDEATIDTFARQGVTLAGVTTSFHLAYRDRARQRPNRPLFPSVRAYPGGGAPKPAGLHAELRDEIGGVGIVSGFGMTECAMIAMSTIRDPDRKLETTEGRLGPGVTVELRDPHSGVPVPPGSVGEIWARGPQLFQGYVDPDDTRTALDARGLFRTGDLGRLDEDGYLVVTGRLKDVIIRKGENISAKEVEDHVFAHPDVADVAVVGLPDDEVGERCCAVIVPQPGCVVPGVAELGEYLNGRGLMKQKWPESVEKADALPRNEAGKVRKSELVRALLAPRRPEL